MQSVTCLATDASLTADPGVVSSIPARSHTFVEIDHEIISTVILLPSAESFKKGCYQLQAKVCARGTRVSAGLKFASDILSEQPQYCSDIWNFLGHFFRHSFYHLKPKMLSALLIMKQGAVLLPFRMVGAA